MHLNSIDCGNGRIWFVADDLGMPVSYGYPTLAQAQEVAELIDASDGQATIPPGVDVEELIR